MSRNLFQVFGAGTQASDESEMSDEQDLSDEDETYVPPEPDPDDSYESDSSYGLDTEEPVRRPITATDPDDSSNKIILGKDKVTQWNTKPFPEARTPAKNLLKIPKNRIPNTDHVTSPGDAFSLFINDKMIRMIVHFTNKDGQRGKGDQWKMTDDIEMKAFIGCLLHTGSMHQNKICLELLFNFVEGNPLLRAAFSKNRFSHLLNHLRFDDKETRTPRQKRDKFAHIRELWDLFLLNLSRHYHPGQSITVDEQLVPFRGRCPFIQYIPSKPDKYGIKIFWVCDNETKYPLRGFAYLGREQTGPRPVTENNVAIGTNTVLKLTEDFTGSGRNVTCDNFFTNLDLAERLVKKNLTLVGTIRRNKPVLPETFQAKKNLPLGESAFLFRKETTLVSYQSKRAKNVLLLSTMHSAPERCEASGKPEIVLAYNKTKGGVDALDQMAHAFTVKRKTKRWPLVIFFNMVDLSTIAARVIWQAKLPEDKLSHEDNRQLFIIAAAREFVIQQIQRRTAVPTLNLPIKQNMDSVLKTLLPTASMPAATSTPTNKRKRSKPEAASQSEPKKQKRCSLCPAKRDRKTKTCCPKCDRHICKDHTVVMCTNCSE